MFTYNSDYSVSLAIFSYTFYVIMLVIASPMNNYKNQYYSIGKKGIYAFFVSYILLNIFSFWEYDTYHSWTQFLEYGYNNLYGYEDVYQKIANITGDDYFLWRCVIWLPACVFIYKSASILEILNAKMLLAIVLFGGFIGYTRGMLGFTMLVFGTVLFMDNASNTKKLLGLLVIAASYYFHKSMYIAILFSIIALYPLSKKQVRVLLFCFPVLASITTLLITRYSGMLSMLDLGSGVGEVGSGTLNAILDSERQLKNVNGQIMKLIEVLPQYLTLYYIGIQIYNYGSFEENAHQRVFKYLFRFAFVGFYIASLFYFTDYSTWIYERFKHIAIFPMLIVLCATFSYEKRQCKWMYYVVIYQVLFVVSSQILRVYSNIK